MNILNIKADTEYVYPIESDSKKYNFMLRLTKLNEAKTKFPCVLGFDRQILGLEETIISAFRREITINKNEIEIARSEDEFTLESGSCLELLIRDDIKKADVKINSGFMTYQGELILAYALEESILFINDVEHKLQKDEYIIIENFDRKNIDLITNQTMFVGEFNLAYTL
ncbi:MAG: hypothetical protein RR543_04560 [Erysipelotrichales bacterium]